MKKIKRILPLVFVLALAGCDSGTSSSGTSTSVTPSTPIATPSATVKPKLILLTDTLLSKYSNALSVTSVVDAQVASTEGSYNSFGKVDVEFKDDVTDFTIYEQTEYDTKAPETPSDKVDEIQEYTKNEKGRLVQNYLTLENKVESTASNSVTYAKSGLGNPFASRKASDFQRNDDLSTATTKVYDRKRKQVKTQKSERITTRTYFFGGRLVGGSLSAFSLTIDSKSVLSYSATFTYSSNGVKGNFDVKGTINSNVENEVSVPKITAKTGTEDTDFKQGRAKLVSAKNFKETDTLTVVDGTDSRNLTRVEISRTENDAGIVLSQVDKNGQLQNAGSYLFEVEGKNWTEIAEIGNKGYYEGSTTAFPSIDFDSLSSVLFAKNGKTFTLDTDSGVSWLVYDYSIGSYFDKSSKRSLASLSVTIESDKITFTTAGTLTLKGTNFNAVYTTVYSDFGTVPAQIGSDITIKKTGDDLVRSDLLAGQTGYAELAKYLGGEDVLDRVPTLGGKFYNAVAYYEATSQGTNAFVYWDAGFNSSSLSSQEEFNQLVNSVFAQYASRLEKAGFTDESTEKASVATKEFEKGGKTYVLTVQYGLINMSDSSRKYKYYFAAIPSVAEKKATTGTTEEGGTTGLSRNIGLENQLF